MSDLKRYQASLGVPNTHLLASDSDPDVERSPSRQVEMRRPNREQVPLLDNCEKVGLLQLKSS